MLVKYLWSGGVDDPELWRAHKDPSCVLPTASLEMEPVGVVSTVRGHRMSRPKKETKPSMKFRV